MAVQDLRKRLAFSSTFLDAPRHGGLLGQDPFPCQSRLPTKSIVRSLRMYSLIGPFRLGLSTFLMGDRTSAPYVCSLDIQGSNVPPRSYPEIFPLGLDIKGAYCRGKAGFFVFSDPRRKIL